MSSTGSPTPRSLSRQGSPWSARPPRSTDSWRGSSAPRWGRPRPRRRRAGIAARTPEPSGTDPDDGADRGAVHRVVRELRTQWKFAYSLDPATDRAEVDRPDGQTSGGAGEHRMPLREHPHQNLTPEERYRAVRNGRGDQQTSRSLLVRPQDGARSVGRLERVTPGCQRVAR